MSIKKSLLNKLSRDLTKYKVKAKSINIVATNINKSTDLVRCVLHGKRTDKYDIIDRLQTLLEFEKEKIKKLSDKIDMSK